MTPALSYPFYVIISTPWRKESYALPHETYAGCLVDLELFDDLSGVTFTIVEV